MPYEDYGLYYISLWVAAFHGLLYRVLLEPGVVLFHRRGSFSSSRSGEQNNFPGTCSSVVTFSFGINLTVVAGIFLKPC